jgi:ATP-dependent Clp protease ATP-binding subunit ClpC
MAAHFDKYPERIPRVLSSAQEEAQRLNHKYIGSEHILLGLIKEDEEVAASVLINMGVSLPKLRSAMEYVVGRGNTNNPAGIKMTKGAERVIERAAEEARSMGHDFIGLEHVLLAVIGETDSVATGVLNTFGVTLDKARAEVASLHPSSET